MRDDDPNPLLAIPIEIERAAAFRAELRRFLSRTEAVAARAGLTPQRYDLLLAIAASERRGGTTIGELAGTLRMRQTAVSELVKRTEVAGLVERRPSPTDGRVRLLWLTAEGTRRLLQAFADLRSDRRSLAAAFGELDRAFQAATRGRSPAARSSQSPP